jgi:hypothetical protein
MDRANRLSRRQWLRLASAGVLGASASGWIETLAAQAAADPKRRKSCILLWMTGGPSQVDTFDPKPGHANNGPFKPLQTAVPGISIGEHLPGLASQMKDLALIRSMSTKEGDHGRATFNLRTGYQPTGPIHYPTLGSLVAKEFEDAQKSEQDRLSEQLTAAQERAAKAVRTAVASKVEALAAKTFADPEDAAGALDLAAYVDEDGQIDTDGIKRDLDDLLKRKPHWARPDDNSTRRPAPDRTQGSSGNGNRSSSDPGAIFAGLMDQALKGR